jgi:hypothetical protein
MRSVDQVVLTNASASSAYVPLSGGLYSFSAIAITPAWPTKLSSFSKRHYDGRAPRISSRTDV